MGLLEELAVRCEAATGPDRELDCAIATAIGMTDCRWARANGDYFSFDPNDEFEIVARIPEWTGDLEDAMEFVPKGLFVTMIRDPGGIGYAGVAAHPDETGNPCASLPLALTAASLRARHALALSKGSEG